MSENYMTLALPQNLNKEVIRLLCVVAKVNGAKITLTPSLPVENPLWQGLQEPPGALVP